MKRLVQMMGALLVLSALFLVASCSSSPVAEEQVYEDRIHYLEQEVEYYKEIRAFSEKWAGIYAKDVEHYTEMLEYYEDVSDDEAVVVYEDLLEDVTGFLEWHTNALDRRDEQIADLYREIQDVHEEYSDK